MDSLVGFHGLDLDKWMKQWKTHRCSLLRLERFAKRVTITMKDLDEKIKKYKKALRQSQSNMDDNNDDDQEPDEQSEHDDDDTTPRHEETEKGRGRAPTKGIVRTRPISPSRHHDDRSRAQSLGRIRRNSTSPTRKSRDMHDDNSRRPRAQSVGRKQSLPSRDYDDDRQSTSFGIPNQMMILNQMMQSGVLFAPLLNQQQQFSKQSKFR